MDELFEKGADYVISSYTGEKTRSRKGPGREVHGDEGVGVQGNEDGVQVDDCQVDGKDPREAHGQELGPRGSPAHKRPRHPPGAFFMGVELRAVTMSPLGTHP